MNSKEPKAVAGAFDDFGPGELGDRYIQQRGYMAQALMQIRYLLQTKAYGEALELTEEILRRVERFDKEVELKTENIKVRSSRDYVEKKEHI